MGDKFEKIYYMGDKFEKIYYGAGAYMWVIRDDITHEVWICYDEEKAHKFAEDKRKETGHRIYCDTQHIVDMYIPDKK